MKVAKSIDIYIAAGWWQFYTKWLDQDLKKAVTERK